MDDILGPT
jgi:hypothetical protein